MQNSEEVLEDPHLYISVSFVLRSDDSIQDSLRILGNGGFLHTQSSLIDGSNGVLGEK